MIYKIELKTSIKNDTSGRIPNIEEMLNNVRRYASSFNGLVILHNSFYDYRYDVSTDYNKVDSSGIIGHITSADIEDDKIFINVEMNKELSADRYICFYRSKLQSTIGSNDNTFDQFNIFAVDLIAIGEEENVLDENLSEVKRLR